MFLRRILVVALVAMSLCYHGVAAQQSEVKPLFEYPQVPDKLTKVNMRSNYMVEHLWDNCDLGKTTITNVASFRETFTDYLSFFILADVDVIEGSVKKFVDKVSKNKTNLDMVIGFVDSEIYNPASQFCSDDVYEIFARHLGNNKKVDGRVKAMLAANVVKLKNSKLESVMKDFPVSKGDSAGGMLSTLASQYTIVIMNVENDFDTSIFKLRLNTDVATNNLIGKGAVSVVSLYSNRAKTKSGDADSWYVATLPDMEDTFDMRIRPVVYVLDKDKKIISKSPTIEQVLTMMAQLNVANQD